MQKLPETAADMGGIENFGIVPQGEDKAVKLRTDRDGEGYAEMRIAVLGDDDVFSETVQNDADEVIGKAHGNGFLFAAEHGKMTLGIV